MRHFANLLKNNRGVTLIELLTALVISTLVLGIAYGLLMAGYKTYEKVGIEQGQRNEADYVVSRIMEKFYEGDISDIRNCEPTSNLCIEILSTDALKISTGSNTNKVGITSFNELNDASKKITRIKIDDNHDNHNVVFEKYDAIVDSENNIIAIDPSSSPESEKINSEQYNFDGSKINATCSYEATIVTDDTDTDSDPANRKKLVNKRCSNGIVDLSLMIKRANVTDDKYKLELKSQFGF
ncbi:PilW family protein [Schinkia azotoformans]|uniref:PilW family protein n=1 Tax=Schinkia azotoformans TaxID=1454 RepID=UPI002DB5E8EB|nr:prepilin-type N-terminal cleavage/methylation domain-containing protein [Schinkia azotoformans]MEC1772455.1 prepilin-type N-terminal cleavage/methylation domain-containing protein [Schinkia azotoformans]MED4368367.1 prepilin-type N-terminal cleavage/methylation domain-containing protein [Schinkia azotoformans]